jgi:division protein CdvB (Snf7/Vps24/ESCRT-III family)
VDKLTRLKELQQQFKDITDEIALIKQEIVAELNVGKRKRRKKGEV